MLVSRDFVIIARTPLLLPVAAAAAAAAAACPFLPRPPHQLLLRPLALSAHNGRRERRRLYFRGAFSLVRFQRN